MPARFGQPTKVPWASGVLTRGSMTTAAPLELNGRIARATRRRSRRYAILTPHFHGSFCTDSPARLQPVNAPVRSSAAARTPLKLAALDVWAHTLNDRVAPAARGPKARRTLFELFGIETTSDSICRDYERIVAAASSASSPNRSARGPACNGLVLSGKLIAFGYITVLTAAASCVACLNTRRGSRAATAPACRRTAYANGSGPARGTTTTGNASR
ncbi:hypothetical protein ABIB68_006668 [Bradyrhizobium sp. F1.2.2]